jgi:A/G-specific adenine glycosylase
LAVAWLYAFLNCISHRIRYSSRIGFEFAGELGHVWYPAAKLADAPLPAPIKKLLLAVFREPDLLSGAFSN